MIYPGGEHVAAVTNINEVKMIALAYSEKYDNGKKAKAKKAKFLSYFLATEFVTTLLGIPEEKKRQHADGTRDPLKLINRCKFAE